ncbi:uncharacterized protein LOC126334724 [Schistocerca gregaria]|uniref:uncharacterized protein LOC126334724 n=1 Tax=Schistocerca gregaria TaxID=7010 RepID=UPI00211EEA19|nr:uncharacterized protein LOC126334724 [Schistocerca gregaria]
MDLLVEEVPCHSTIPQDRNGYINKKNKNKPALRVSELRLFAALAEDNTEEYALMSQNIMATCIIVCWCTFGMQYSSDSMLHRFKSHWLVSKRYVATAVYIQIIQFS